MAWYKEIHEQAKEFIAERLRQKGEKVEVEARLDHEVQFDVFDETNKVAYEVLTAKFFRSSHEKDEAIIAKIFRYLLHCRELRFVIASYNHEEIEFFHNARIRHWHIHFGSWWHPRIEKKIYYHPGVKPKTFAKRLFRAMLKIAPLREWISEGRARKHRKQPLPDEFSVIRQRFGLPENFLKGLWRDWRLQWVLRLERCLGKWKSLL